MLSNLRNRLHTLREVLTIAIVAVVAPFYVSATETDSLVFKWSAEANLNSHYIWRGLNIGGLNVQPEVAIGFEGFRAGMWWNIGAESWGMQAFLPEVDVWLSYSKYGVTLQLMEMYYFDHYKNGERSRFFDYSNHGPGEGGVTTEVRLKYCVSEKIPLRFLWGTRFSGRDGYYQDARLRRAYSTYIELGYDFALPWELILQARLGITPWRSLYTSFEGNFAVVNTELQLRRAWELTPHMDFTALIDFMVNPYMAAKKKSPYINANIGIGLRWK